MQSAFQNTGPFIGMFAVGMMRVLLGILIKRVDKLYRVVLSGAVMEKFTVKEIVLVIAQNTTASRAVQSLRPSDSINYQESFSTPRQYWLDLFFFFEYWQTFFLRTRFS